MKRTLSAIVLFGILFSASEHAFARTRVRDPRAVIFSREEMMKNMYYTSSSSSMPAMQTHKMRLLSLRHPSTWHVFELIAGDSIVTYPVKEGSSVTPAGSTRVFITTERTLKEKNSSYFYDAYFLGGKQISADTKVTDWYLPSFALTFTDDATVLGRPGRLYGFTAEWQSRPLRGEAVVTAIGETIYHVEFRAEPEQFEKDYPLFKAILQSIALQAPATPAAATPPSSKAPRQIRSSSSSAPATLRKKAVRPVRKASRLPRGASRSLPSVRR